tara:strand:+ start:32640 stop:33764 length:1125 start_codon:yes stop_codon:yes gene_type:complete
MSTKTGLFLTGGGARGAYQAGVLKALAEISPGHDLPFDILSGASTGAINAAFIGSHADDFNKGVRLLTRIWAQMDSGQVFKTDNISLALTVMRTMRDIVFHRTPKAGQFLLNTDPLRKLLSDNIDFKRVNQLIEDGVYHSIVVSALNYETSESVAFFNSNGILKERERFRYRSQKEKIRIDHILASSAIPIFFPSVEINDVHYGDGTLRNHHPLRSTIELGADKLLIVSLKKDPQRYPSIVTQPNMGVSFGNIIGMVFNSIFLDSFELDLEMLDFINHNISALSTDEQNKIPFRKIDTLILRPTKDLGELASNQVKLFPRMLRYLLGGFGKGSRTSDMYSYLMFEAEYCQKLIQLGYKDTIARRDEIQTFLSDK